MIKVSHLTKSYGTTKAVDDISFTMQPGHIYGLLGPNGAGKTTTMNMMTGYLGTSSGTVTIDGYDIFKDQKNAKKRIGYLPEVPPLYLEMTVLEYLVFVIELKGIPRKEREKELKRVVKTASLKEMENRLIRNLSKGYRQRVGFAAAIVGNPKFIILDEPTVGLDPRQLNEFRQQLEEMKKDHIILLSSHILSEVNEVCDYIFIISQGKLILSEKTSELCRHFESRRHLNIHGIGDGEAARMALLDIPVISEVKVIQEAGKKEANLEVEFVGNQDIRARVSELLMELHFAIVEMKEEGQSLEDVFLQLTDKKAKDKNAEESDQASSKGLNLEELDDSKEEDSSADKDNKKKKSGFGLKKRREVDEK